MTRALILTAHPDDESLFCGNLMLAYPEWQWSWWCACSKKDSPRGQKLERAAEAWRKRGVNIDHVQHLGLDEPSLVPEDSFHGMLCGAMLYPGFGSIPDIVLTHNRRGDYGHPHHCAVNYAAHWMFRNIWEFAPEFESGVGPQWTGTHTRHYTPRPAKREVLAEVYTEEMEAIKRDRYPLHAWALWGAETFSANDDAWPDEE